MTIAPKNEHLRCHALCPDGNCCNLGSDIKHFLCICEDPHCYCHSPQRYGRAHWADAEAEYRA